MSETAKGYNYCLDVIKGIAVHVCGLYASCEFQVSWDFSYSVSRDFVSLYFFMISGYYLLL